MARKKVEFSNNPLLSGPSLVRRTAGGSPYRELQLSEIETDPDQPRRVFDDNSLADLANSIKEHGVLTPILVKLSDGGVYRLVAGERRLRASKIAGKATIPAVVIAEQGGDDVLAKQLIENLQREDLSSMERALAIGQLKETHNWSIREIAKRLGVSKALVQRSLDILALPDELQTALIEGASESKVLLLGSVEDSKMRLELLNRIDELTRKQLESAIKGENIVSLDDAREVYHGGTVSKKPGIGEQLSPEDERIVREIQRKLSTKVLISRKKSDSEKGRITLEFYSSADLDEIYRRLTS